MEDNRERQEIVGSTAAVTAKSMGSIHGNEIAEEEEERREQEQHVGQMENAARLRLMEISKAVPPTDEVDSSVEEHSQSPPQSDSSSSSSSPSPRPDTEEEIRRKLMSISYSYEQPLSNPGQPVAG